MNEIKYNVVTEKNSYCERTNLKHTTDVLIPIINNYLEDKEFNEYTKYELTTFLESLKESLPFEFIILTDTCSSSEIPNDEIWLLIHNHPYHNCRIELKINSIFRSRKIKTILDE